MTARYTEIDQFGEPYPMGLWREIGGHVVLVTRMRFSPRRSTPRQAQEVMELVHLWRRQREYQSKHQSVMGRVRELMLGEKRAG